MKDVGAGVPGSAESVFGLSTVTSRYQQYGALAVCTVLALAAILAALFGRPTGPVIAPFVPMTATICAGADLLTAFLLLAQFYVNGSTPIGLLGAAYAFTGFMSLAFLAAFPGLFLSGPLTIGDEQMSSVLWWIWHCTFPIAIMLAVQSDTALGRMISRRRIAVLTGVGAVLPFFAAVAISALVYAYRNQIPHLIVNGEFQPLYKSALLPFVVAINALACAVLIRRLRPLTPLALWVAVATFSATLDALLVTLSSARYSYAWDTGKIMTVFTSSIVLLMILCDVVGLYGGLARVARIDALTTLANRRAYDEHFKLLFGHAQKVSGNLALLIVDIDFFKRYNDTYGHLAGDECLRWVARALASCATRPLDLVARYGGEEFAILLPETPLHGILVMAERVRSLVERLEIVHGSQALGRVTVSIGICYTSNAADVAATEFFEAADRGLYEAKDRGRNRVVLGSLESHKTRDFSKRVMNAVTARASEPAEATARTP